MDTPQLSTTRRDSDSDSDRDNDSDSDSDSDTGEVGQEVHIEQLRLAAQAHKALLPASRLEALSKPRAGLLPAASLLVLDGLRTVVENCGGRYRFALAEQLAVAMRAVSSSWDGMGVQLLAEFRPPSLLSAVEGCPPLLHKGLVGMLKTDGLTCPTFMRHRQALREAGEAGRAAAWRVELHRTAGAALLDLQSGAHGESFATAKVRQKVARLLAPARPLETHSLALTAGPDGTDVGVGVRHPSYVATVHAGKPASRFLMDPQPREGKGAHVRGIAAGKAAVRALPTDAAIRSLAHWCVGRALLAALGLGPALPDIIITRPSRFALLLLFYEGMVERCRLMGLLGSSQAYEAAAAWLSGASYLPTMGLETLGVTLQTQCQWIRGAQAMMVEPHAIYDVWAKQLYGQMYADRSMLISLTDGQKWSHPYVLHTHMALGTLPPTAYTGPCHPMHTSAWIRECAESFVCLGRSLNAGDQPLRSDGVSRLLYSAFARSARLIYDSLDASRTVMVIDVSGKIPQHAAAYGARLHDDITLAHCFGASSSVVARWRELVALSLGRTVDPYKNRVRTTKENAEGLHSVLCLLKGSGALIVAGITLEHGGSSNGKLQATQAGFVMERHPKLRPRGMNADLWKEEEERRVTRINAPEMLVRLATAHLTLDMFHSIPYIDTSQQSLLLPGAPMVPTDPVGFLAPFYSAAHELLRLEGVFRVTPWAAAIVSVTRWDLQRLIALDVSRRQGGATVPMLMVRPPNEAPLRNGLLISELGPGSQLARWRTPHRLLVERCECAGAVLPPPPPIWWDESSSAAPREPSVAEEAALAEWRQAYMVGRSRKGSALADSDLAAQILPPGRLRLRRPPRWRLLEEGE